VNLAARHPPGFFTPIRQNRNVSQIDESGRRQHRRHAQVGAAMEVPSLGDQVAALNSTLQAIEGRLVRGHGAGLYVGRRLASEYLS
jgi:hypothetical protein